MEEFVHFVLAFMPGHGSLLEEGHDDRRGWNELSRIRRVQEVKKTQVSTGYENQDSKFTSRTFRDMACLLLERNQ
jgi:hypothetical protein